MRTAGKSPDFPWVSIIIPAYNTAEFIGEALESVFAQTFTDYEVIVINDGSPDSEKLNRVLEDYRSRITYIEQEHQGLSRARNNGIHAARGKYLALLDSDDSWEPEYLAEQVDMLEGDPSIDVLSPNALIVGASVHAGRSYQEINPSVGEVTFERLVTEECSVFVGVTARREAIVRAGLFDEALHSVEDFDLWLRVVKSGGRIVINPRVLARYRKRAGSLSADSVWMYENLLLVLDKAESTQVLSDSELRALNRQRVRCEAMKRLEEGKGALFRGDVQEAIGALTQANLFFRSRKVKLAVSALRLAPRAFLQAYLFRERLRVRLAQGQFYRMIWTLRLTMNPGRYGRLPL